MPLWCTYIFIYLIGCAMWTIWSSESSTGNSSRSWGNWGQLSAALQLSASVLSDLEQKVVTVTTALDKKKRGENKDPTKEEKQNALSFRKKCLYNQLGIAVSAREASPLHWASWIATLSTGQGSRNELAAVNRIQPPLYSPTVSLL